MTLSSSRLSPSAIMSSREDSPLHFSSCLLLPPPSACLAFVAYRAFFYSRLRCLSEPECSGFHHLCSSYLAILCVMHSSVKARFFFYKPFKFNSSDIGLNMYVFRKLHACFAHLFMGRDARALEFV